MTIRAVLDKLYEKGFMHGASHGSMEYIEEALTSIASEIEKEKLDENFGDQVNRPRNEAWNNAITEVVRKILE